MNTIFTHFVDVYHNDSWKRGTLCAVLKADGSISVGSSICSDKDNYCRRKGRDTAQARALDSLVQDEYYNTPQLDVFLLKCLRHWPEKTYNDLRFDLG